MKIGWDATEVKKGFSALRGMFGASLRGLRQVGIGAARQIGAGITDLMGRIVMAVPEGMKEMMDWAGNLNDMSAQTGLAVSKIALLEEALRMSGAEAADTSKMLSTLAANLFEAQKEAGPARDALSRLGFYASDFEGVDLDKAFESIGKSAAQQAWKVGEFEQVMSDLFGAKMGYKLIRFFKDYDANMKQADRNVGDYVRRLDKTANSYDKMGDALGRWRMRWRELMSIVLDQVTAVFGDDFIDKAFDFLNPDRIRQTINWAREGVMGFFQDGGFKKMFQDLGREIGVGIKESIRDLFPKFEIKNPFSSTGQAGSNSDAQLAMLNRNVQQLVADQRSGNRSLMKIENLNMGWA